MLARKASFFSAGWTDAKLKVGHVILFVAVVCISLIAISTWGIFNSLEYHLHDKETEMSNLSKTLSSNIEATLTQADTVLIGAKERLETEGGNAENLNKLEELLKIQQKRLPQIHGFLSTMNRDAGYSIQTVSYPLAPTTRTVTISFIIATIRTRDPILALPYAVAQPMNGS
jgi:hypothetical protein